MLGLLLQQFLLQIRNRSSEFNHNKFAETENVYYIYVINTSSALVFFVTGLALGEMTSPNKLTAALTDSKGALVSISPTSNLGEPLVLGDSTRAVAGESTELGEPTDFGDPIPFCHVLTLKPNIASSTICI